VVVTTLSERRRAVPRANMVDVARVAGVSLKTVSRVVNRKTGVHPTTAQRVRVAIDQLGFRRNAGVDDASRDLSTGTSALGTEARGDPVLLALIRGGGGGAPPARPPGAGGIVGRGSRPGTRADPGLLLSTGRRARGGSRRRTPRLPGATDPCGRETGLR